MRSQQHLFWTNQDETGKRRIVPEGDPEAAVALMHPGDWMPDVRAERLGVTEYVEGPGAEAETQAEPQRQRAAGRAVAPAAPQALGREERIYLENSVGTRYELSARERGEGEAPKAEEQEKAQPQAQPQALPPGAEPRPPSGQPEAGQPAGQTGAGQPSGGQRGLDATQPTQRPAGQPGSDIPQAEGATPPGQRSGQSRS